MTALAIALALVLPQHALAQGALSVTVHSAPRRVSVPPGAQRVPMLGLQLQASCGGPVRIDGLTLVRRGLGRHSDVQSVYAVADWRRLGRGRGVANRTGEIPLRLRGVVLPPCGRKNIDVYADFAPDASVAGEHRLELVRVLSDATVVVHARTSSHPSDPSSPLVRTAGPRVGAIDVTYLDLTTPIRYGANRLVSRFRLEADNVDDHLLRRVRLKNEGSATGKELENLYIQSGRRERLTDVVPWMNGDSVELRFNPPFVLPKNRLLQFGLRADVRAKSRKTIRFVIEEPGDIDAVVVRGRGR